MPAERSPSRPAQKSNPRDAAVRIILLLVGLGFVAVYLFGRNGDKIALEVVNASGKTLKNVELGDGPATVKLASLAEGESTSTSVPLAAVVFVRLKHDEGPAVEAEFPFQNQSGFSHKMKVTIEPPLPEKGDTPQVGRQMESSASLLGYEVQYRLPLSEFEPISGPARGK
ncbi:MAG: hypothetical protein U0794_15525 [Isosphaeraceae bacterium]